MTSRCMRTVCEQIVSMAAHARGTRDAKVAGHHATGACSGSCRWRHVVTAGRPPLALGFRGEQTGRVSDSVRPAQGPFRRLGPPADAGR